MSDRNANIIVSLRNEASPAIRQIASDYRQFVGQLQASGAPLDQAERKMLALAQAKARTLSASGQAARGEQELTAALGLLTRESVGAYNAQTQLINIQNKGARSTSGFASALGDLKSVVAGLGVGFGLQQLVSGGIAAASDALQLRETKNSLKAVAGDTQTYSTILQEARRQQLLFGGSMQENIDGLQGLAVTSRQTGARLESLIDLQKRLTVLNPAQGAQGGLIALNEALAGNITSLSRRFNIPRETIRALGDEAKPVAERLQVLDQFLSSVGVTSAAVVGKVDQDALAFRRLGQELGDLKLNQGDRLATSFAGAATGLSRLIGLINGNPQALAELRSLLSRKGSVDTGDIDQAARDIAASRAREQLGGARAQPIIAQRLGGSEQYLEVARQLQELALRGGDAAAAGARLTQQFIAGSASGEQYRAALDSLVNRTLNNADAEDRRVQSLGASQTATETARQKLDAFTSSLSTNAQKGAIAEAEATALKTRQAELARDSELAARGLLGSGDQALLLANKYNLAASQAAYLISLQQQIATDADRAQFQESFRASERTGGAVISPTLQRQIDASKKAQADAARAEADKQRQVQQSQFQLELARATTAGQRVAILKRELATTSDTVERNHILAQIASEQHSTAKAQTSELTKQLNLEERIADSKEKQLRSVIDAQLAILDDRKQRRQDEQELAKAQRIVGNPLASAKFKDAAQDVLARIPLEQARRALDIREQLATAGGQIVNGRIFQGQRASELPALPGLPPGSRPGTGLPALSPLPPVPALGAGGAGIDVKVYLDSQQIAARVVTNLRSGFGQAQSAGAGRP